MVEIVFDALGALGGLGLLFRRGDRLGLVLAARKRHGHAHAAGADQKQRNPRQAGEDQDGQKPPATANACGREKSCRKNSLGRLLSWLLRVTNMPAASEIRKAGTCVTSPSPIVSVVNSLPASIEAHARSGRCR